MKPRVLLCAFTAKASNLINGIIFHSAFGQKVGNSICYLSDKKRAELRESLSELKLVIIDEISMVGADMLYTIHLRLCTLFKTDEFMPFANVNKMLVGDLLQLPPVLGVHVFREPKNEALKAAYNGMETSLWEECQPMILKHNHHQGESKWLNPQKYLFIPVNMSLISYSKSCQFAPHGMNFIKPQMHLISSDLFSNHITFDKL